MVRVGVAHYFFYKIRKIITCNIQVILHKGLWVCIQIEYYL